MRLYEVAKKFADEQHCIEHLVNMRWPNGVRCVYCNSDWVARYDSHGKTGKFRRVYECGDCHKQFTAQSGTLFHDSHLPLQKWFMAIALMCESKKGISANQLARSLGVTYKTAWYLAHRIREAMTDGKGTMLSGIIEIDETYVGGKRKGVYAGKRAKTPVIGMRERGGDLKFIKVPHATAEVVKDLVRSDYSTHKLSTKHMQRYLHEFEWRFNRRKQQSAMHGLVLRNLAQHKGLQYKKLTAGEPAW